MYPLDDALISPAPHVTALEASSQPSEPIRQQQSKAVDTAATLAALDHIKYPPAINSSETCRENVTYLQVSA